MSAEDPRLAALGELARAQRGLLDVLDQAQSSAEQISRARRRCDEHLAEFHAQSARLGPPHAELRARIEDALCEALRLHGFATAAACRRAAATEASLDGTRRLAREVERSRDPGAAAGSCDVSG